MTPEHHIGEQDESAMIGSIIFDPSQLDLVAATVAPRDLFDQDLSEFYQMLIDLHELGRPINDMVLLNTERKRRKLRISAGRLGEIFTLVPNAQHAMFYAANVAERSTLRRLAIFQGEVGAELQDAAKSSDDILNRIDASVKLIGESRSQIELVDAQAAASSIEGNEMSNAVAMTGFAKVDERYGGFSAGELVVIGARLGCGKTAMGWQMMYHNAKRNRPCLFVSLEMEVSQLMERHYTSHTGVPAIDIRSGNFNPELIQEEKERFGELPITLFSPPTATVRQIAAAARLKQSGGGLSLLVVDYIGKVKPADPRKETRDQIAQVSGDLKTLARELKIPVVGLAQLNRFADNAKQPRVSHLADSDNIGRDADQIFLLNRDRSKGTTELRISKHRYIADDAVTELHYQNGKFSESDPLGFP